MLTVVEKIRVIAKRRGLTMRGLAEKTEQTPQNLCNKLNRRNFTLLQIEEIGEALGCEVEINFIDKVTGEKF